MPAALVSRRPDVRSSELALTAANADVAINKAALVSFAGDFAGRRMGQLHFQKNWFNIPGSLFGMVVGGLTQPVFQRKKLKTAYQISEVDREKTVIQFKQTVLVAVGEVSDALAER